MEMSEPPTDVGLRQGDREGGGPRDRRWGMNSVVMKCLRQRHASGEYVRMQTQGRGCASGSAHLRTRNSSDRRYLRGAGVQSGQKCPLCSSAREYRRGRPVHKGRTTARQVRPYAWPKHPTQYTMSERCAVILVDELDQRPDMMQHMTGGKHGAGEVRSSSCSVMRAREKG
jgi:hypothetical protein